MINCVESLETISSKELKQANNYFIENIYALSPINPSPKKVKQKTSFKDRTPLRNWTMPTQPEGYIRAGKYDLL